jgi:hypothetical protein
MWGERSTPITCDIGGAISVGRGGEVNIEHLRYWGGGGEEWEKG